jgi:hypothetical protein
MGIKIGSPMLPITLKTSIYNATLTVTFFRA